MAVSNRERVGQALELLGKGLRSFFMREMHAAYGEKWDQEAAKTLTKGDGGEFRDVQVLLKAMWDHWNGVFGKVLGQSERTLVSELRTDHNRWAHQESFSTDDAYRSLDSAYRLLTAVSAADEAAEVDRLKQELLRVRFNEQARQVTKKAAIAPVEGQPAAGLKSWRQVVTPHEDVASGRYQRAEFAADLGQVLRGEGSSEYSDPKEFYERTFITDGLHQLLTLAVRRLSGSGGDPVIELQTNFGGGKTHSMLALYHLVSGAKTEDLAGIEPILREAEVSKPPPARRAVLVGTAISPGQPHEKADGTKVQTLWGELAWQLGGREGFGVVAEADRTRTSPGAGLVELLKKYAPCLILIDEWVAYARQLYSDDSLPGGSFDTQFTFAQALTEAVKGIPGTFLVVSIPASDTEIGGEGGKAALDRLKNAVGRIQSPWRPASAEESFEIVRRRLFQPITEGTDFADRDAVIKAFGNLYRSQAQEFPPESREKDYERRLEAAYPIHPELFDRLYGSWASLERFQRTRGVLRLMAAVIHTLWERQDSSLLIMPATVPVDSPSVQSELTRYLEDPWVPVIEKDVDGPHSLPLSLDRNNPNLGRYSACRRVARAIYMGSAPTLRTAHRGIEETSIKLGCVQPGESVAIFGDALRRLTDQATHLYVDGKRYWFSTQPSVTRLAQDRTERWEQDVVDEEIIRRIRLDRQRGDFGAVHVAPGSSADVPDDMEARLVVLDPDHPHAARSEASKARARAAEILERRGGTPRLYRNMLIFLAPDGARLEDLRQAVRSYLAWKSICDEHTELNLDAFQQGQAETKRSHADDSITQRIPEAYQWALVPAQLEPQGELEWEELRLQGQEPLAERASKKLRHEEYLITEFAASRLRMELDRIPLWRGDHVGLKQLWEDFAQYLYLPRLRDVSVLIGAIQGGLGLLTWEQDAFAYAEGWDEAEGRYRGLRAGEQGSVMVDGRSVLVRPEVARSQVVVEPGGGGGETSDGQAGGETDTGGGDTEGEADGAAPLKRFHGTVSLDPLRLKRDIDQVADAIVQHLSGQLGASVEVTLEIQAELPNGASEEVVRTVTENAKTLKFNSHGFERD